MIQQLRDILKGILEGHSKLPAKIALLKSFKESLTISLNATQKTKALQNSFLATKQPHKAKAEARSTVIHCSEGSFLEASTTRRAHHLGQLGKLKQLMLSVCHQYEKRVRLNHQQHQLQQRYSQIEVKQKAFMGRGPTRSLKFSELAKVNRGLRALLKELVWMKEFVRVQNENIGDIVKVLRVAYAQLKERRGKLKGKKGVSVQEGEIVQIRNDENRNQYLVNL